MRKIMNDPTRFVDECLEGIAAAHPGQLRLLPEDGRVCSRADAPVAGKVGIVTGGGSGHLPTFLGYVGKGLADSCAVGNVFSSPGSEQIFSAMKSADGGRGILQLFGCYQGDKMNFKIARAMAEAQGIPVETVIGCDDIASAPAEQRHTRRGIAGLFFAYKVAGACAQAGMDLQNVAAAAQKAVDNTRSFGASLSSCTIPQVGQPGFHIEEGTMEIGMGIHGEPGIEKSGLLTADALAERLMDGLLEDMPCGQGDLVAVLVNGLGATPLEELYILYRRAHELLSARGVQVHRCYLGEYATSLEMAGASISLLKLDEELRGYLDAPAVSPFFIQPGGGE